MKPFFIDIPQEEIDDLRARVESTRWPAEDGDDTWDSGIPLSSLKRLAKYWTDEFSWNEVQKRANAVPQFISSLNGADIHFMHVRSPEPDATPLLITHGWPGSFLDFIDVVGPLADPRGHGAEHSPAFHVVVPSLPGFGFSSSSDESEWTLLRVADTWAALMTELGYERFVAQGGDLGATVSRILGLTHSDRVIGTHVNFLFTPPPEDPAVLSGLDPQEAGRLERLARFSDRGSGYMKLLSTRPRTIGYGLTDSPVGQLAWTAEKFHEWSGGVDGAKAGVPDEAVLADVSLYWLTRTAISSARIYYDNADSMPTAVVPPPPLPPVPGPLGVAVYANDLARPVRSLAHREFPDIVQWSEFDRGGHFPSLECPEDFVADLRDFLTVLDSR